LTRYCQNFTAIKGVVAGRGGNILRNIVGNRVPVVCLCVCDLFLLLPVQSTVQDGDGGGGAPPGVLVCCVVLFLSCVCVCVTCFSSYPLCGVVLVVCLCMCDLFPLLTCSDLFLFLPVDYSRRRRRQRRATGSRYWRRGDHFGVQPGDRLPHALRTAAGSRGTATRDARGGGAPGRNYFLLDDLTEPGEIQLCIV